MVNEHYYKGELSKSQDVNMFLDELQPALAKFKIRN